MHIPHGGRVIEARRLFPDAPSPLLDLSAGISPYPYDLPAFSSASLTRLPEPEELAALEQAAARRYGAGLGCVVAAPGSQAIIGALPRLFGSGSVAVLAPTYAEHSAAWQAGGHAVREAASPADFNGATIAVLCNPNNPDGRRWNRASLLPLADARAAAGGALVVDEAYADFAPAGTSLAQSCPHPGLVVLRSFGKAYGLPGLRLGFALAPPSLAAALRQALGPWPVSGPAIAAGLAALPDTGWLSRSAARLESATSRLDALLSENGLDVRGGTPLFRLAAHDPAHDLWLMLCRAGVLTRRFAERPGWLRFGLPPDEAGWTRLATALADTGARAASLSRGTASWSPSR